MPKRLTVVISQTQSKNPAKRELEEGIVEALLFEPGVEVTVIPNLYDLKADSTGMLCLSGIGGDMVIASWLYPRAAHWILDRSGIRGRVGETLLDEEVEDDELDEDDQPEENGEDDGKLRVIESREPPKRAIYCLDLRQHNDPQTYVDEIKRLSQSTRTEIVNLMDWVQGTPPEEQLRRFQQPTNDTALGGNGNGSTAVEGQRAEGGAGGNGKAEVTRIEENAGRRWYPVIDYSRCTNCMECIDFCLFGVYGVDQSETILVEQPDNCRKGCPACSRVCPENAIIFPQHKSPAIAGSPSGNAGLKIDLSQLFGAPDALDVAARERDEQLLLAGRDAVGTAVGMPKRQQDKPAGDKDALDNLIDELDELDV